jgi:hypothetical protein
VMNRTDLIINILWTIAVLVLVAWILAGIR